MNKAGFLSVLGVVMLCGCEAETLVFEEPTECRVETLPEESETCYRPSACCDISPRGFAALCETYYPHQPTPVMCTTWQPTGDVCVPISPSLRFNCEWGTSRLYCCDLD